MVVAAGASYGPSVIPPLEFFDGESWVEVASSSCGAAGAVRLLELGLAELRAETALRAASTALVVP